MQGCNTVEFGAQRIQAVPVDRVHGGARSVEVSDFLFVRRASGTTGSGGFEHGMQDDFVVLANEGEGAIGGTVVGNGIEVSEVAAGVLGEIDAGVGSSVDEAGIQARRECRGLRGSNGG